MTDNKTLRAWRASFTRRWHTNPDLCDTVDYDAGHQGRVALLLLSLFPDVSRSLLIEAIIHDQGEVAVGDIAYDVKRTRPLIKAEADLAESTEIAAQGLPLCCLTVREARMLKLCDWLDSWLWMMRHARHLYARADWQDQLARGIRDAEWLGVGPEVQAVVDAEVTR